MKKEFHFYIIRLAHEGREKGALLHSTEQLSFANLHRVWDLLEEHFMRHGVDQTAVILEISYLGLMTDAEFEETYGIRA